MATLILTAVELANPACEAHKTLRALAEKHLDWWDYCHSVELEVSNITFRGFVAADGGGVETDSYGQPFERTLVEVEI